MRDFLRFVLWVLAGLGLIGLVLYLTVFDAMTIPNDDPSASAAMEPTLSAGDHILTFRSATLKVGYLVRCADPDAPGRFVIGRLGGVGGDTVEVSGLALIVNGKHVASPRRCDQAQVMMRHPITGTDLKLTCAIEDTGGTEHEMLSYAEGHETTKSVVEIGKYYLISDNRFLHVDSREYGPVDPATCQHIVYRLWGASGYFDASRRYKVIW